MKIRKSSPFSFKPTASIIALSIAAAFALTACGGGGGDDDDPAPVVNAPSRVSASADIDATGVEVNTPLSVIVGFSSQDGTSTGLAVTSLGTLPAGWSAAPFPGCTTVTSEASDCQLTLTYTPDAVTTDAQSLPITFTYTDDEGVAQTGTFDLAYSAVATAPSRVSARAGGAATGVTVGTPTDVTLSFISRNGTSTALTVTSLGTLPAEWSAAPGFTGCDTVTPTAADCQLTLTYNPAAATDGTQTLPITFAYTDDEGAAQTGTFSLPYSAGASSGGGNVLGYLAQYGADAGGAGGNILRCSVASDTGVITCAAADASTPPVSGASAIAVAGNNMYVLSDAGLETARISRCVISNTGALSNPCEEQPGAGAELGATVDLAASSDYVYALKANQLQRCGVSEGTISTACGLGDMSAADEAFLATSAPTVARSLESITFKGDRIWMPDSIGAGSVVTCAVTEGVVNGCATAWTSTWTGGDESDPAPSPVGIAFNSDFTTAYVLQRDQNNIVKCTVGAAGLLSDCAASVALPVAAGDPNRIAVQGNYVYVARGSATVPSNDIVRCTLAGDGSVNGASCTSALPTTGTSPITSEITDLLFTTIQP